MIVPGACRSVLRSGGNTCGIDHFLRYRNARVNDGPDKRRRECPTGRVATFARFCEGTIEDVGHWCRDRRVDHIRPRHRLVHLSMHDRHRLFAPERYGSDDDLEQDDTEPIEIGAAISRPATRLFRRHVRGCPGHVPGDSQVQACARIEDACQTEVTKDVPAVRGKQDVGWLDIPVQD